MRFYTSPGPGVLGLLSVDNLSAIITLRLFDFVTSLG